MTFGRVCARRPFVAARRTTHPRPTVRASALFGLTALLLAAACSSSAAPPPKTVVLVTLDTLRSDHLSCYGYARETSPFLDRMAEEGVRFTNAIAASSHTAPTHASILTSLYPTQHRVLENGQRLRPEFPTLAGVLREAGYDTAAFLSVGFLQGLDPGFDHFVPGDYDDTAIDVLGRAEAWLRERQEKSSDRPLFLWVHLYDAHQPYVAQDTPYFKQLQSLPEEERDAYFDYLVSEHGYEVDFIEKVEVLKTAKTRSTTDLLLRLIDNYDAEIRLADGALESFHAAVTELGLNRDALWLFLADHGEGLGNHGLLGHDMHLYQEQVHIPLIVRGTGGRVGSGVVEQLARQVDVLPTVLDWADVPPPDGPTELQGVSLLPCLASPDARLPISSAFSQRRSPAEEWIKESVFALQTPRYKYIFHGHGRDELYDLELDPLERVNLIDAKPQRGDRLRRTIRDMIGAWAASNDLEPLVDGDGHGAELSELGYAE